MLKTAVLLLVFRRADFTALVLEALQAVRPARLYIAADGPRADKPGEADKCQAVRDCLAKIDWPCEVFRNYAEQNMGSKRRVSTAITWFFEHEPDGIILEDDCVPDQTFFRFCEELLERYRDDEKVMLVSGDRGLRRELSIGDSYYYSRYALTWGWATWRRAWQHYDVTLPNWEAFKTSGRLRSKCFDDRESAWWTIRVERALSGALDAWDFQWMMTCWMHDGLAVIPKQNLIKNVGFREDATHTTDKVFGDFSYDVAPLQFPLKHPAAVVADGPLERKLWKEKYEPPSLGRKILGKGLRLAARLSSKLKSRVTTSPDGQA